MPFFWYEGLVTGIRDVDAQHGQLLDIMNDLERACRLGQSKRELWAVMERLAEYTRMHFLLEERLMEESAYPGKDSHVARHEAFIEKIMAVNFFPDEDESGPLAMLRFLRDWLIHHIREVDMDLARHLGSRPEQVRAGGKNGLLRFP